MAYLTPHFDPDVFVSYSHGDPHWRRCAVAGLDTGAHPQAGELDFGRSKQNSTTSTSGWTPKSIRPLTDPRVEGKGRRCGVLMIVMSKRYLKSSWCRDELEWFREQSRAGRAKAAGCSSSGRRRPTSASGPTSCATGAATR